jgi:hypothetical protein
MRKTQNRAKRSSKKPQPSKPLKRKIHDLDGQDWSYDINSNGIRIRNPDGSDTQHINQSEFTGWSWNSLERAEYKRSSRPEILPSDVVGFIRREFLKTDPDWKYDSYHRHLRFAQRNNINLRETTFTEIERLIAEDEARKRQAEEKRDKKQVALCLENLDLLLRLTNHQTSNCSDENLLGMGPLTPLRRIECTRCWLLHVKEKGWDPKVKLHLVALQERE